MEETHTFPESKVRAEFINTSVAVDMVKLTKDGSAMVLTAEDAMTIALTLLDRKNQNLATPPIRLTVTPLPAETRERIERIAATALAMHFQKPDPLTDFAISDTVHNALIALAEEERREREKDAARLDWLEAWAKKSPTGISFDHVKACEGDPSGFRFMRRFYIGQPRKSVRAAIDSEMDHNPPTS